MVSCFDRARLLRNDCETGVGPELSEGIESDFESRIVSGVSKPEQAIQNDVRLMTNCHVPF